MISHHLSWLERSLVYKYCRSGFRMMLICPKFGRMDWLRFCERNPLTTMNSQQRRSRIQLSSFEDCCKTCFQFFRNHFLDGIPKSVLREATKAHQQTIWKQRRTRRSMPKLVGWSHVLVFSSWRLRRGLLLSVEANSRFRFFCF